MFSLIPWEVMFAVLEVGRQSFHSIPFLIKACVFLE